MKRSRSVSLFAYFSKRSKEATFTIPETACCSTSTTDAVATFAIPETACCSTSTTDAGATCFTTPELAYSSSASICLPGFYVPPTEKVAIENTVPAEINDSVTYDIGDIVSGKIKTLSTHDKFMYLKHHFTPDKKFPYFTQTINSGKEGVKYQYGSSVGKQHQSVPEACVHEQEKKVLGLYKTFSSLALDLNESSYAKQKELIELVKQQLDLCKNIAGNVKVCIPSGDTKKLGRQTFLHSRRIRYVGRYTRVWVHQVGGQHHPQASYKPEPQKEWAAKRQRYCQSPEHAHSAKS
eukprot:Em0006g622a